MPKGVYVRTEIARRNNSLGHKGIITWMKGKHHTEITKEKMRLAHLDQRPTQKCIDASRRVHTKNRKCSVDGCRNKHEGLGFCKWHYQRLPQVRARMLVLVRKWQKENPRSNSHFSIELQIAMNNIRKRDNNTCQWSNCGLTNKETTVYFSYPSNRAI